MSMLSIVVVIGLIATICALGAGVVSMVRGGEFDHRHGSELMVARVGFQGVAVMAILIALFLLHA